MWSYPHPVAKTTTSASSSLPSSNARPCCVKCAIEPPCLSLIRLSIMSALVPRSVRRDEASADNALIQAYNPPTKKPPRRVIRRPNRPVPSVPMLSPKPALRSPSSSCLRGAVRIRSSHAVSRKVRRVSSMMRKHGLTCLWSWRKSQLNVG